MSKMFWVKFFLEIVLMFMLGSWFFASTKVTITYAGKRLLNDDYARLLISLLSGFGWLFACHCFYEDLKDLY